MHVGIIPDGNRRWAKLRGATLHQAYAIGFFNGIDLIIHMCEMGIRHLTVYALSRDNYANRLPEELEPVISQITDSMSVATHFLRARGVRVRFVGDVSELANHHQEELRQIEAKVSSSDCPAAEINVLVNYSVGWDFAGNHSGYHATVNIPDCDLVFRSGGARRLSGFLPKQSTNAELFFVDKLWPDVRRADITRVISRFKTAKRNFGR